MTTPPKRVNLTGGRAADKTARIRNENAAQQRADLARQQDWERAQAGQRPAPTAVTPALPIHNDLRDQLNRALAQQQPRSVSDRIAAGDPTVTNQERYANDIARMQAGQAPLGGPGGIRMPAGTMGANLPGQVADRTTWSRPILPPGHQQPTSTAGGWGGADPRIGGLTQHPVAPQMPHLAINQARGPQQPRGPGGMTVNQQHPGMAGGGYTAAPTPGGTMAANPLLGLLRNRLGRQ